MAEAANSGANVKTEHYRILNALRFVLALWVAIEHQRIFKQTLI
jgi:hypothetical protein